MRLRNQSPLRWVVFAFLLLVAVLALSTGGYNSSQAATANCPDISPLPCESVRQSPNKAFSFEGGEGGLTDRNGVGTGFTMVDPPTTTSNPAPNPYAKGYWPDKLTVSNGQLSIATTPGISYLANNNQDNALGVGLDLGNPSYLQTTLVNLGTPPGGSAQAGLWFGKAGTGPDGLGGTGSSQDNYIKLVVISTSTDWQIQMLWEQDGAVVKSSQKLLGAPGLVKLHLDIDPGQHTVTSRYCTTADCDASTAAIYQTYTNVPLEWFSADAAGINLDVGTRSMGGIFATRRSAASAVTFTFEDFFFNIIGGTPLVSPKDGIDFNVWTGALVSKPTSMVWGPDGRLYVSDVVGNIYAYTFDFANRKVTATQTITAVQNRLVLGITVDPASTPSNVILWVSHSYVSQGNGQANSGTVSRLSGANFATRQDVITGLPRAIANHATNSLHFGPDGKLYIAQGGNTGAGGSNDQATEFGPRPEQPLSAAILVADVKKAGFDGTCTSQIDPTGAQMDATGIAATDHPCDVQVYASGLRNPYDFVFHSNGQMYATENGVGVLSSTPPLGSDPLSWDPSMGCLGMTVGYTATNAAYPGDRPDLLQRIVAGGFYGHPNPSRNECLFFGANPTANRDFPVNTTSETSSTEYMENTKYPVGMQPAPNWQQPLFTFGRNKSANSIIEYNSHGQAFCGRLDGELLTNYFSQSDQVRRVKLAPDGLSVVSDSALIRTSPASGGELLVDPLPIAQDPSGRIFVGTFSSNGQISVLEPANVGAWDTNGPSDLPAAILDAGSAVLDSKLYAVAGKTSTDHLRTVYAFTPAGGWTRLADLPADYPAVENPAVVAYNGKLYVFGGSTDAFSGSVAKAAVYDPAGNSWSMLPDMGTPRGGPTAQVIGSKIYVAGGMNGGASLATMESFDLNSQTWQPKPAWPRRATTPAQRR